tara:strand:+ start:419 stop:784 length:366 start_codon:yes stop_codon:yes gene_type:complete
MADIKLKKSKDGLELFFPDLFTQIETLELSNVSDPAEKLVESGVRLAICDQLAKLPQIDEQKIDILVYKGSKRETPTAIEFKLDEVAAKAIGSTHVCAKVFLSDRKEYEPRLFDILPINTD